MVLRNTIYTHAHTQEARIILKLTFLWRYQIQMLSAMQCFMEWFTRDVQVLI